MLLVKWFRNFTSYIKSNIKNIYFLTSELKTLEELFISADHHSHAVFFLICDGRLKFISIAELNCVLCEEPQMSWECKVFFLIKARTFA